jgi:uncharacterized membrane protein YhaH (DUF805 family)
MDLVNIFITFTGRINRAKFWIGVLVLAAIDVVLSAVVLFGGGGKVQNGIITVATVLVVISSFGIAIKRLHDRNKSGWYALLLWLAPLALLVIGVEISELSDFVATVLWLIAMIVGIWSFVELGCLRGTIGSNPYGVDPLAPEVLTPPVRTHA